MEQFYQKVRWLELKAKILDKTAYNIAIHDQLKRKKFFDSVLDCGTGTGLFVRKLSQIIGFKGLVAFDINPGLIEFATKNTLSHLPRGIKNKVQFIVQDLYSKFDSCIKKQFDLITGQAFLEHTNPDESIEILSGLCKEDGWMYFPHNYSGVAVFEPGYDPGVERQILDNFNLYTIENQIIGDRLAGDSYCGQKLPHGFRNKGFRVLNFSTSDWVLTPKGRYSEEEKEILEFIIDKFYEANTSGKVPESKRLTLDILNSWKAFHKKNIEEDKLTFICLQTSILVEKQKTNGGIR